MTGKTLLAEMATMLAEAPGMFAMPADDWCARANALIARAATEEDSALLADADAVIAAFCEHGEDIVYATGPFLDRVEAAKARHAKRQSGRKA